MAATKKQEYEALKKIKGIVNSLGENSYIATAFEGCFEIAEENIEFDFAGSMKQKYESAQREIAELEKEIGDVEQLKKRITDLEWQLEKELEWKPYTREHCMSQTNYEYLVNDQNTRALSEEEAKELLYKEFGFAKERVIIMDSLKAFEINRHGGMRQVGFIPREPLYNATDWYYIRFNCGGITYEAVNDQLEPYTD